MEDEPFYQSDAFDSDDSRHVPETDKITAELEGGQILPDSEESDMEITEELEDYGSGLVREEVESLPSQSKEKVKIKTKKVSQDEIKYMVDQEVECIFNDPDGRSDLSYFRATITRVNENGTYDVEWKDQDLRDRTQHPTFDIRLPETGGSEEKESVKSIHVKKEVLDSRSQKKSHEKKRRTKSSRRQPKKSRLSSSTFIGIIYRPSAQLWFAERTIDGIRHRSKKGFKTQIQAAKASDSLVHKYCKARSRKLKLNFPAEDSKDKKKLIRLRQQRGRTSKQRAPRGSSQYLCVSYRKNGNTWQGQFQHKGTTYSVGQFKEEYDAAVAVNKRCKELMIPLKNPSISVGKNRNRRSRGKKQRPSSKYKNVNWHVSGNKWTARMRRRGKPDAYANHKDELTCAQLLNEDCRRKGYPLPNPDIDDISNPLTVPNPDASGVVTVRKANDVNQKSIYKCVFWHRKLQKWLAQVHYEGRTNYLGYHVSEVEAAEAVNKACRALGIPEKNPDVASRPIEPQAQLMLPRAMDMFAKRMEKSLQTTIKSLVSSFGDKISAGFEQAKKERDKGFAECRSEREKMRGEIDELKELIRGANNV